MSNKIKTLITRENLLDAYEKCSRSLNKTGNYFNVSSKTIKRKFLEFEITYDPKKRYSANENFFDDLNEKSMYWLGVMATDGCVRKHNYSYEIRLSLATKDICLLEDFKKDINYSGPILNYSKTTKIKINKNNRKEKIYYNSLVAIRSQKMFDRLCELNIVPNKTYILRLSEIIKNHKFLNHFIRGCIDGDGWARLHKNNYSEDYNEVRIGFCGTKEFVNDIFLSIEEKLDIKSGHMCPAKNSDTNKTWRFEFSSQSDVYKIYEWIYNGSTSKLDRKYQIIKKCEEFLHNQKIIEKNKLEELYNDGYSMKEMATYFDVGSDTIRENLIKNNIQSYMLNRKIYSKSEYNYEFFNQNDEYSFYWAGFIAGKSSYVKDEYVRISTTNKNILEKFLEHSKFKINISDIDRTDQNRLKSFRLEIYDNNILQQLKNFNINEDKQNNFYIPEIVLTDKNLHHFLRGYLEARSGIQLYKNKLSITINNSKLFIEQLSIILINNFNINTKTKLVNKLYQTKLFGKDALLILKYLYDDANIFSEEKFNIYEKYKKLIIN